MKKFLVIPFLLSCHLAFAGTGSAKDVILLYLVILLILASVLGVYFLIDFIRKIMKKRREKERVQPDDHADDDECQSEG